MSRIFSHRYTRFAAFALVIVVLLAMTPAAPAIASPPFQERTGGFLVFGGTVVGAPRLNVRDAPTTSGRILGKLDTGARVAVVGRSGGWYLIRYPAAPVGLAWVNSSYVQLDGQPAPVAARSTPPRAPQPAQPARPARPAPPPAATTSPLAVRVEAPALVDFNNGVFRWQWYGDQGQLSGIDWYTDILLFFKGETLPYRTFVANPGEVQRDGPFFMWNAEPFRVQCDTVAVARIAVRANGEFVGWVSDAGVSLDVGPACSQIVESSGGGSSVGGEGSGGGYCAYDGNGMTYEEMELLLDPEKCQRPEFAGCAPCGD
jgi:hypothetical protein